MDLTLLWHLEQREQLMLTMLILENEVIYKLLEDIQLAMEGLPEPDLVEESLGKAEVRVTFVVGKGAIAGCYIQNGKLQRIVLLELLDQIKLFLKVI